MVNFLSWCLMIVTLVANWFVFKKMGCSGWEGIVPFYNMYVLCGILYDNANKFWLLFIPFYNIYFTIRIWIDLAKGFHKSTGYGFGLFFLYAPFMAYLAWSDAKWKDGSQENKSEDVLTKVADEISKTTKNVLRDEHATEKIEQLEQMKEQGLISEEEFESKKKELLERV